MTENGGMMAVEKLPGTGLWELMKAYQGRAGKPLFTFTHFNIEQQLPRSIMTINPIKKTTKRTDSNINKYL